MQPKVFRTRVQRHAGKDASIAEVMHLVPAQVMADAPKPQEHVERELGWVLEYCDNLELMGLPIPFDSPKLRAGAYAGVTPHEFPPNDLRAMFGLAQHYGIPTRLLDWTHKPLIAAYFAAVGVARMRWEEGALADSRLAVWAINTSLRKWYRTLDPGIEIVSSPSVSNPNLHAQGGRFTLVRYREGNDLALSKHPPTLDELLGMIALDSMPREQFRLLPALVKVTLPCTEARSLLRILADYQVTAAEVTPGHRGAADALLERKWWQWANDNDRS